MTDSTKLIKICSSCGQEKPLSAFLMMTEHEGTGYGEICATCRSAEAAAKKIKKESDGSSHHSTGHDLGNKAHLAGEESKATARLTLEKEYYAKRQRDAASSTLGMFELINEKAKEAAEKDVAKKKLTEEKKVKPEVKPAEQEKRREKPELTAAREETQTKEKLKQTTVDHKHADFSTQFAGQVKHQSSIYKGFLQRLGLTSPAARTLAQAAEKQLAHEEKPKTPYQRTEDLFKKAETKQPEKVAETHTSNPGKKK